MKNLIIAAILALGMGTVHMAYAEEGVVEKVEVKTKNAKRAIKKKAHRLQEKMCRKDDGECLEKKARHRATEMNDSVKDKASELKNKID